MYDEHFGVEGVILIYDHTHSVFGVVVDFRVGKVVLSELLLDVFGNLVYASEFFDDISVRYKHNFSIAVKPRVFSMFCWHREARCRVHNAERCRRALSHGRRSIAERLCGKGSIPR